MHFDGQDGGTPFTDVKGHAVTPNGAAELSTAQSVFGGSSGHFDGTSAYLTMPSSDDWNFYAGDFTVELFVQFEGGVAAQDDIPTLFGYWGPGSFDCAWQISYDVNWNWATGQSNDAIPGTVYFILSSTGSDEIIPAVPWTPEADTWYHFAVVRSGSTFSYFVDGTLIGAAALGEDGGVADWNRLDPASNQGTWYADGGVPADASIHANSTAPFSIGVGIGAPGSPNTQSFFKGFIDEARITKGVARYTSNFARPTQPFPSH
jgi:hypothetical protein